MRLADEVEILRAPWTAPVVVATLPAEVHYTTVAQITTDGRNALVEELRCIIEPYDYDALASRIRWRGEMYENEGPPMVRRFKGEDHHLTISLRRVTG